jgi:Na+-translocating ferredoxin:NAD+ oxidoreductase subunit B
MNEKHTDKKIIIEQKLVARIHCGGNLSEKRQKGQYEGIKTCSAASLITGGTMLCSYSCQGFGDCIKVCKYGAIKFRDNLPPEIDEEKCTACGMCMKTCPKNLIELLSKDKEFIVACASHDKEKVVKQACDVGCIACELCVKECPNKAILVDNYLAKIDCTKCQNVGECFKVCSTKCIQWKR